uniref:beta-galactoside alpha-(2,6)-sialyltransferase n=1 Tax=Tetraselmis sp. GSL018 TaxID=582737 RepID=A0A061QJI4_9CHLO
MQRKLSPARCAWKEQSSRSNAAAPLSPLRPLPSQPGTLDRSWATDSENGKVGSQIREGRSMGRDGAQPPRHHSHRQTALAALLVFLSMLVAMQAASYTLRLMQGERLPENRRKHWHSFHFLSQVSGVRSAASLPPQSGGSLEESSIGRARGDLGGTAHGPALRGSSDHRGDMDLDAGMAGIGPELSEDGWWPPPASAAGDEPRRTTAIAPTPTDGTPAPRRDDSARAAAGVDQPASPPHPAVPTISHSDAAAPSLRPPPPSLARGRRQAPAPAPRPPEAAHAAASRGAAEAHQRQSPAVPVRRPQQAPAGALPAPPTQRLPPGRDPRHERPPGRHRPASRSDQLARVLHRLYRGKKAHQRFTGSVAMSRATLPPVGSPIKTPWKVIPSGEYRTLGRNSRELMQILPAKDVVGSQHYRSCAVVGSAGNLLQQDFGREIDSHDCVIRFNIAPTKGFEKNVGSKTTLRFVNRLHFGFRETSREIVLQHVTMPDMMAKYVALMRRNPGMQTFPFDMSFYEQMVEWDRVQQPTNGFFGLKLALHLCDRVVVYGFVRNWRGNFKYHYFNNEEPNAKQFARDNGGELPLIKELMQKHSGRMSFKHPCVLSDACEGCPSVARCDGATPFPVPVQGFCRRPGTGCWLRCATCPGGRKAELCPAGLSGQCVS